MIHYDVSASRRLCGTHAVGPQILRNAVTVTHGTNAGRTQPDRTGGNLS